MKEVLILSSFTKKLNLLVTQNENSICNQSEALIETLFENVTKSDSYEKTYDLIEKDSSIDILFLDADLNGESSLFSYIRTIRNLNPLLKIILFTNIADKEMLFNCINNNIAACIIPEDNDEVLKRGIKNCVEQILVTVDNRLLQEKKLTLEDCYQFLLNRKEIPFKLVNHYKGIPIIREAYPVEYSGEDIIVQADITHMQVLQVGSHIVISSNHLGIEILTEVIGVNKEKKQVTLRFLNFLESYVHNRKNPRITPQKGSYIIFYNNGVREKLEILNISIDHVLVQKTNLKLEYEYHEEYDIDINCMIDNKITGKTSYLMKTKGYVKELFRADSVDKMLLKFELDKYEKSILDSYIVYQAKEAILELKTSIG